MEYVYNYHPDYKNYVGFGEAFESPLEPGVFIVPAHATKIPPPLVKDGEIQIFNERSNKWEICEDQRGTWYNTEKIMEFEHFDPKNPPENATRKKPPISHIPDLKYNKEEDSWEIDVQYTEGDYPVSNIFPEILPSPEVKYKPQYSEELGRWTFVLEDDEDNYSDPVLDELSSSGQTNITTDSKTYQPVIDRIRALGIDYDLFKESLQTNNQGTNSESTNSELDILYQKLNDLGLNIDLLRSLLVVTKDDSVVPPSME